ncbi:hypothetical protein Prudu_016744 [Prunus dulcis]|uniref:Uncharacterized protein n=1 Tax=Prunus dulcis TaxID=3755 RepID=A0A4Y1RND0_PRUDU|nr:hypothetical protein Prudu_016744 [Prunus dulcis]
MKMRDEPIRGKEINSEATNCYCGRVARLQISWIEANPFEGSRLVQNLGQWFGQ